ncbi:ABC-type oligopeptide transport system, periplasmic component [Neorhizobium galegae bv. officinalis bv. officinalis str. HAMBI 1141]|uniref:ABC-type oligopeptide transport system, periplasmic component n=1 Tax=Neorhizobium galegae bv. officinalis bv. officinalis str. HAMBI 1141 TaxID=1028801 RepID=A0A068TEX5_NEOGA|nr:MULTISPECIES: extracellular solute-binding protein [Neorhizobium]MCJ9751853.1 extracellular solute-binding protein [Neorhizobium sp. BETTINA12A]CDN56621.1 ABC-type oligopeptide transport system, periplasmic component [Neorhizobium galegae bv. officinalis bv. officinalis str. HAMBI 1141]
MLLARLKIAFVIALAAMSLWTSAATAQEPKWRHGMAVVGDLKLPADFKQLPYVDVNTPKAGELRLGDEGTFDNLNLVIDRGTAASGVSLIYDTLMKRSEDEVFGTYGLLAEAVSYPDDVSSVTFRLRQEAKWADGQPVTPEDVIFSLEKLKEHSALYSGYYRHVTGAEKTGDREVTFRFDEKNNRELPSIVGDFPVLPKHWWEGKDAQGNQRDISRTTLEPPMGSGPYKIGAVQPGSTIRYELRDDYWGKNLPINLGQYNFRTINYTYFSDADVEFEAFRAGNIDYRQENSSSRWVTRYDFDAVKDGRVIKEALTNPFKAVGVMQAFVPNMRRDIFKDARVREALNYAYDFEDLNKNLAYGGLKRVDSFFWGTELASSGLPQGKELEILNGLKDKVPARVFTTPYTNPVGGDPNKVRDNLRTAISLLKDAGWELKGNRMLNAKTGQPLSFEILLNSQSQERTVMPYVTSLKKIGIDARLRIVDASQYINRIRSFDYDMMYGVWAQTMNPGNEQADYWGSASVSRPGSRNYAGIADPAVDQLISMITAAQDREDQVAAVKAMDRVLLANHYVVPMFYSGEARIAYWNRITHPQRLPEYSIGFPETWSAKNPAK